jgi:hypothetical protein
VPGSQAAIILYILLTQRGIGCYACAFYYDVHCSAGRGIVGGSRKKIVAINNIDVVRICLDLSNAGVT